MMQALTTYYLWRALAHSHKWHPITHHNWSSNRYRTRSPAGCINGIVQFIFVVSLPLYILAVLGILLATFESFLLGAGLLALLTIFSASAMLFFLQIFALIWLSRISGALQHMRMTGLYDLLCLAPAGALALHWMIGYSSLRLHFGYVEVRGLVRWLIYLALAAFVLLITGFLFTPDSISTTDPPEIVVPLLLFAFFMTGFVIEFTQSIVLCVLFGMWIPTIVTGGVEARFGALAAYLITQITVYVATIVTIVLALRLTSSLNDIDGAALGSLLTLLVYYGLREIVIRYLWARLLRRVNAESHELYELIRA